MKYFQLVLKVNIVLSLLVPKILMAQEIAWADKILGFSSEYRTDDYGSGYHAVQILGKPNKLPSFGDSPCAWSPAKQNTSAEEWIKVGFEKPIRLAQVMIGESFNPGAISKVLAYNNEGKEFIIAELDARPNPEKSRQLRIDVKQKGINCTAIKIVMQTGKVPGYNQIDAIGISADTKPIQIEVNTPENFSKILQKENLGKNINSKGTEIAPVISSDGSTLFFTRANHPENVGNPIHQDIWISQVNKEGVWEKAVNAGSPLNTPGDNAVTSISSDGRTVYLINKYLAGGNLEFGFSYSKRTKTGWMFPRETIIPSLGINQRNNSMEVTVSPLGNVLLLALERPDTEGKRDIYVCFQNNDKKWTEPLNIGKTINTAAEEGTPFLALDNKTLYFTSYGHSGYGQGDLFVTKRLDDSWTKWSEPQNLGPNINTSNWDGYFNIPASGDYAYFSSTTDSFGEYDIFRIRLTPEIKPDPVAILSGQVFDKENNKLITANIKSSIADSLNTFSVVQFDSTENNYQLFLPLHAKYNITAEKENYFTTTEEVDLSLENNYREIKLNLYLQPIKTGQQIRLSNYMFAQSSSIVSSQSRQELEQIVTIMGKNPTMKILLEGHTDNQGDTQKNIELSQKRVDEVKKYLIEKGVDPNRVTTKAWGPAKPLTNNLNEQNRQKNRRVEFTILNM